MKPVRILVINPNSSTSITDSLESTLVPPPSTTLHFFTGPPSAPPSINDDETANASSAACLPALLPLLSEHDAFLVACYSDHPLVPALRDALTSQVDPKPVIGILEASVTHSLLIGRKFGIVTTGKTWEKLLTKAVNDFLGGRNSTRFTGVASTGLGVLELHNADQAIVRDKIGGGARRLVEDGADVICLGCAGMAGMEEAVLGGLEDTGKRPYVVDGVVAGTYLLAGLIGTRKLDQF